MPKSSIVCSIPDLCCTPTPESAQCDSLPGCGEVTIAQSNSVERSWQVRQASGKLPTMLEVRDLSLSVSSQGNRVRAVSDVSLTLQPGRVLGLVGESGCGKSLNAQAILRLVAHQGVAPAGGEIRLDGKRLCG